MNTITGAFADPTVEVAMAAQLFRSAYQGHLLLLGMATAGFLCLSLIFPPDVGAIFGAITFLTVLSLIGRVLLHRMPDLVRSQQIGAWTWTLKLVLDFIAYISAAATAACAWSQDGYLVPALGFLIALINGSHGMKFLHKFALIGLMVVADIIFIAKGCPFALVIAKCDIAALGVGSAVAHMAELQLRRNFATSEQESRRLTEERRQDMLEEVEQETRRLAEERRHDKQRIEQLQISNERLLYDMQRHGRPLDDDSDRSAIRRGLRAGPGQPDANSSEAGTPSESPPPSLPPGAPSSSSGASVAPLLTTWEEDDRQHYAGVEAQRAAWVMAEQKAPPNIWWVDAGRQRLAAENAGVKRGRPALERVERVELAELAALAEMADDETVVALQNIVSSGHVSSTCSPAQVPAHCGPIPAQANLQIAGAMVVAQPHRIWDPSALQARFNALVMCNFTPRNPRELPPSRWVSYGTLFRLFEPYAPAEVWQVGPGNLKQLITKWFQGHPVFAGLVPSVWCKQMSEKGRCIYKFSFEYTPR